MSDMATYPEEDFQPAPKRSSVFFGANGLRAGWGLLLFFMLLAMIFAGVNLGVQTGLLFHHTAQQLANPLYQPVRQVAEAVVYIVAVILAARMLARRNAFGANHAVLVALLLAASLVCMGGMVQHFRAVQKAGLVPSNPNNNAPPSSAPAPNALSAEVRSIAFEAISFGMILLVTWIMSRVEHRRMGEYGLGGNARRWPQFAQGLVWGFLCLSLLVGVLYLGHWITFGGVLLHSPGAIFLNGLLWFLAFLMVGFFEEFTFRGYMQFTLARGIGLGAVGFFIAALLFNFSFGFAHGSNPGESPIGLWQAGLIGFVFCISLWYTRSLWWAIGFHATWDWAESYFYGTADSGGVSQGRLFDSHPHGTMLMSGGATGPEGSVLCFAAVAFIALIIWATLRREHNKSTNQALINPVA